MKRKQLIKDNQEMLSQLHKCYDSNAELVVIKEKTDEYINRFINAISNMEKEIREQGSLDYNEGEFLLGNKVCYSLLGLLDEFAEEQR